jgi:hypothetical protein
MTMAQTLVVFLIFYLLFQSLVYASQIHLTSKRYPSSEISLSREKRKQHHLPSLYLYVERSKKSFSQHEALASFKMLWFGRALEDQI